jgi:hypothetical protein
MDGDGASTSNVRAQRNGSYGFTQRRKGAKGFRGPAAEGFLKMRETRALRAER